MIFFLLGQYYRYVIDVYFCFNYEQYSCQLTITGNTILKRLTVLSSEAHLNKYFYSSLSDYLLKQYIALILIFFIESLAFTKFILD